MPYQELDFPFSGGIDEKTQSQLVEPGSALVVSNLRQQKNGSYQKVFGNSALSVEAIAGGTIPVGKRLLGYKDELLQTDGLRLESFSPNTEAWRTPLGYAPQTQMSSISLLPIQSGLVGYDLAVSGRYCAITYVLFTGTPSVGAWGVFAAVIDLTNDMIVHGPVSVSGSVGGASPPSVNVLSLGSTFVLLYALTRSEGTNIWGTSIDTSTASTINTGWLTPNAFITDASDSGLVSNRTNVFDACVTDSSTFAIVYNSSSSTSTVKVVRYTAGLLPINSTTVTSSSAFSPSTSVSIAGSVAENILWVATPFSEGSLVKVIGLDPTTLSVTLTQSTIISTVSASSFRVSVCTTVSGGGMLCANGPPGGPASVVYVCPFSNAGGAVVASASPLAIWNTQVDTRPFFTQGRAYVGFRFQTSEGDLDSIWIADLTATFAPDSGSPAYVRVIANPFPRLAQSMSIWLNLGLCSPHVVLSGNEARFLSAKERNTEAASLELVSLDWSASNVAQPALLGDSLALSGGLPSYYDGSRCAEMGFLARPYILSNTVSGSGTDALAYQYVAVYEHIDAKGQWHQSDISNPFVCSPQPTLGQTVHVVVTNLPASNRSERSATFDYTPDQIRIVLYRTTGTAGDKGTVFFRVPGSETINDPFNATSTISDSVPDSTLVPASGGIVLYTQPEVPNSAQPKVNPPPLTNLVQHANRLVGSTGNNVYFSGQHVDGEGPWFADLFQFPVGDADDITALASLDGALVVFKRDKIAYVDGDGPPDNGTGGDFSQPQFIAADVGCIEPRSLVILPAGAMFQSLRGIELLTRGRSLANYFGSPVEESLVSNPVITSATLDEIQSTVTFTCQPSEDATTGVQLIWDYVHQFWTKKTVEGNAAIKSVIMQGQDATTIPVKTWLRYDGAIFQEGNYLDNVTYVSSSVQMPWIKMAGLQGYGRTTGFVLLFDQKTPCDIRIDVEQDYRIGPTQTRLFVASEIAALRDPKQIYVTVVTQKCESVRFTITDLPPSDLAPGTGQGAIFIGARVEYQQKQRYNRQPKKAG